MPVIDGMQTSRAIRGDGNAEPLYRDLDTECVAVS
jgi:hypothetical protein